jgi:hypothetical protein
VRRIALVVASAFLIGAASGSDEVRASFRRVLTSPEATASMTIERSDPFGGPPTSERGKLWILSGRGLRYRSLEKGGQARQEVVIDRQREIFQIYSPAEQVIYKTDYSRAPGRLRRIIAEPERFLGGELTAKAERRRVHGVSMDGFRIRGGSVGDSLPDVNVWTAKDKRSGLPRWITISSPTDTVWIEFKDWKLHAQAKTSDLAIGAPPGTKVAPLNPRELLERESGGRESR